MVRLEIVHITHTLGFEFLIHVASFATAKHMLNEVHSYVRALCCSCKHGGVDGGSET